MPLMCPKCFDDAGLERRLIEIRPDFPDEKCDFHPTMKGIPVEDVANIIDDVFRNNYEIGQYRNYDGEYEGEDLESILYELTGASDHQVVSVLAKQLVDDDPYWPPDGDEPFYSDQLGYVKSQSAFAGHSRLWDEFRASIVHGQRFFNDRARELLSEIFDGIHLQRGMKAQSPVFEIRPGDPLSSVMRVRAEDDHNERQTIRSNVPRHLGAPPSRKRRAGRMNPSGITAFYGAFELETCIAELRPTVGSFVVGARFDIIEPLWVLDTTRFAEPFNEPNVFSKDHVKRTAQWRFMQRFMHEIAQPISANDEHLDYIPTQAVAEYLLNHHEFHLGGQERRIEAIIYSSAQHPEGRNIVLLGDACLVEPIEAKPAKPDPFIGPFDDIVSSLPGRWPPKPLPRLSVRDQSFEIRRVNSAEFNAPIHHDYDTMIDDDGDEF
ncbi:hypothetical protein GCM10008179_25530 [Hansschlegelia plantiphila]|uniref:RES domain-containing protein n=1 Tax=Hansschlegelia plantiphila TaxID=374655 RepID=A0A9W6J454_9HYPH|nr:hypothetical protein GCM10008179_25530 [Hansschlegelia plantiphila]